MLSHSDIITSFLLTYRLIISFILSQWRLASVPSKENILLVFTTSLYHLSRPWPTPDTCPVKRPVSLEVFLLYWSSLDLAHHSWSQTCIMHLTSAKSILDPWHIILLAFMALFLYLLRHPCFCPCLCFLPLVYFIDLVLFLSLPCPPSECLLVTIYTPSCLISYKYPSTSPCNFSLKSNKSLLPIPSLCSFCPTGTYARVNTWPLSLYPISLPCFRSYSWPRQTSALLSSSSWSGIRPDFDPEKTWTWHHWSLPWVHVTGVYYHLPPVY